MQGFYIIGPARVLSISAPEVERGFDAARRKGNAVDKSGDKWKILWIKLEMEAS